MVQSAAVTLSRRIGRSLKPDGETVDEGWHPLERGKVIRAVLQADFGIIFKQRQTLEAAKACNARRRRGSA